MLLLAPPRIPCEKTIKRVSEFALISNCFREATKNMHYHSTLTTALQGLIFWLGVCFFEEISKLPCVAISQLKKFTKEIRFVLLPNSLSSFIKF
uniref:Uncharacterized protein n=1 Tax=Romanomermis culicivorax TaxID=13658 RepID=A0A915JL01_ROMCU